MSRATISLCMIVKNEEKFLEACLESAKHHVDEMIIVDTGSTDATLEIANRYQAKVYHFDWIGDFGAARNYSIQHATSEYVLVLDADERIDEKADLQHDIRLGYDVYQVPIKNYNDIGIIISQVHTAWRLFKNHFGFQYAGALHEQLVNPGNPEFKLGTANFVLHHMGYLTQVVEDKGKKKRNLDILQKSIKEDPSAFNFYNLGVQYRAERDWEKAFHAFAKAFEKGKHLSIIDIILFELGQSAYNLKWYEAGIDIVKTALPSFPDFTDLHFQLARLYEEHGYMRDAESLMRVCLELGESDNASSKNEGYGSYFAHLKLAEYYSTQNKRVEALDHVLRSLRMYPVTTTLSQYLRITQCANVPVDEVYATVKRLYPMNTAGRKKEIASAMMTVRHPLLEQVLDEFNARTSVAEWAIATQCNRRYEEARAMWFTLDTIHENIVVDVISLAIILQDVELLERFKKDMNFNKKEWQVFKKLVLRETPDSPQLTKTVEKTLLMVAELLILLQADEAFEALSLWVMNASLKTQVELARKLDQHQLSSVAFDYLMNLFEDHPDDGDVIELAGDICLRHGQFQDAFTLYSKLLQVKPEYGTYSRLYDLYQQTNHMNEAKAIAKEMHQRFPLSLWAEQTALSAR